MAVLIEGISVVIRCDAIVSRYEGGQTRFMRCLPNDSLRADGSLAALTFMVPDDVRAYVEELQKSGLQYKDESGAQDIVVVDQISGPCVPCDWVVFGIADWNGDQSRPVSVCSIGADTLQKIVAPNGWSFDSSLSARRKFLESERVQTDLTLVSTEGGVDTYLNVRTGEQLFVGRSRPG